MMHGKKFEDRVERGAIAVLTLKSGVQYEGKLDREQMATGTVHLSLPSGGWFTADIDEIAGVEAKPS